MRTTLALIVTLGLLSFGCDATDISDNDPINTGEIDASVFDADPNAPDADDTDADPNTPDASDDRAQLFCDRYETLCGFDGADNNRFDDETDCETSFNGFDAGQQDCVEGELDLFENDGNLQHCGRATGTGPCN